MKGKLCSYKLKVSIIKMKPHILIISPIKLYVQLTL